LPRSGGDAVAPPPPPPGPPRSRLAFPAARLEGRASDAVGRDVNGRANQGTDVNRLISFGRSHGSR